jgi:hypothetical protein
LVIAILERHFWGHYLAFFGAYVSILFAFTITLVSQNLRTLAKGKSKHYSVLFLVLVLCVPLAFGLLARDSLSSNFGEAYPHTRSAQLEEVRKFLAGISGDRPKFLAPEDTFIHWKLKEPRHGFPHSAHTFHISAGWWEQYPDSEHFSTPNSRIEYCGLLTESHLEMVFLDKGSSLNSCFEEASQVSEKKWASVEVGEEALMNVWVPSIE